MADFDITAYHKKVQQIKAQHDQEIEQLHQRLAKEVEQLHADIPPGYVKSFKNPKGSVGKTGLKYPVAQHSLLTPEWYPKVLSVLDQATNNPNITFKDLQRVTGVKQVGNILRHIMPTGDNFSGTHGDTFPGAQQYGGKKVITTGDNKPGVDYQFDYYGNLLTPRHMLGMPMFYKGKQIHLFPEYEQKYREAKKKKIAQDFQKNFQSMESVDAMKDLIRLIEQALKQ